MIYILDLGNEVLLAGTVATKAMLAEGWREYYGEVPSGTRFKLDSNGWLRAIEEPKEE